MKYQDFCKALETAEKESRFDDFRFSISLNHPNIDDRTANIIWRMKYAHINIRHIRACSEMTQAAFSKAYGIPKRSLEDWEADRRHPPAYLYKLLAFSVYMDAL